MIDKILSITWNEDGTVNILTSQYHLKGCYYQSVAFPDVGDQPDAKIVELRLVYKERVDDTNMREW